MDAFHVFLIRPSKYDDEGYVIRHWRAVVPSNSLACLHALTEDVRRRRLLGEVDLRIEALDEAVTKAPLGRIRRLNRRTGGRVLVCLVGVQTNQFCRAADIALDLRRDGVAVMIGGFHVSGMLAMFDAPSPEIQELIDAGVTVVAGEIENRWADLLRDAWERKLKPVYRFLDDPPELTNAPRPLMANQSKHRFIHANYGTIDCSRGCPFDCSFCTIINVQGRKTRWRSPACVAETIREANVRSGTSLYFFTDDNFSRNPAWEEIFDRLIALREREGIAIQFIMQADILSYRMPRFIEKAARAGCCSVFIGMESLNSRNLEEAHKTQNRVREYKDVIAAWRAAHVRAQIGYIIGFQHDTEESVRADLQRLIDEVQPDQANFFMMIPLPGSRDHKRMVESGGPIASDYNMFDSCHETMEHPHLKDGAWTRAYEEAWRTFYSFENMKAILARAHPDQYWDVLKNFYWYRSALVVEGAHPMLTGFFRLKDRETRRACFPREGRIAHLRRRMADLQRFVRGAVSVTLEMEELWLETRKRSEAEARVLDELASIRRTRRDLEIFWATILSRLRHGRIEVLLRVDAIVVNALREMRLASEFLTALVASGRGGQTVSS